MTANNNKDEAAVTLTSEQIAECISVLETLNSDSAQIFEIPKDQRLALIMAAGLFSLVARNFYVVKRMPRKQKSENSPKKINTLEMPPVLEVHAKQPFLLHHQ